MAILSREGKHGDSVGEAARGDFFLGFQVVDREKIDGVARSGCHGSFMLLLGYSM